MQWTLPTFGETKTIRRFALFPKRIGNVRIWLQPYLELVRYECAQTYSRHKSKLEWTEECPKEPRCPGNWYRVTLLLPPEKLPKAKALKCASE